MTWTEYRRQELTQRLAALFKAPQVRFVFLPSAAAAPIKYFPEPALIERDLREFAPDPFVFSPWRDGKPDAAIDVVMVTGVGDDCSPALWRIREQVGPHAIIALWLWDNHWAWPQNLRSIMAADLIFVSHGSPDHTGYLRTPVALLAGHIAACSAQWARAQAGELGDIVQRAERQHKALINYVDYGFAWSERTRILKSYAADLADADVFLMPPDDRSRYFSLSPMERFAEWCRYKATIVIPIRDDLSTRVFDALLAGLIPIVPHSITDLDRIIPAGDQERLGIVRIDSLELPTAAVAVREALRRFEQQGTEGIMARFHYALDRHMLVNRVTEMLFHVWQLGTGARSIRYRAERGLYAD